MTSRRSARCSGFVRISTGIAAIIVATITTGCGRPGSGGAVPTPTHIVQPTPDPTMVEVIRGNASPVAYLPPLEIRGSPPPTPVTARPAPAPSTNRSVPKPAAPAREAPPARESAPVSKPAPSNAAPRPAPTAVKPANSNPGSGAGAAGATPAIINPNTLLPGGPARPNATPGR